MLIHLIFFSFSIRACERYISSEGKHKETSIILKTSSRNWWLKHLERIKDRLTRDNCQKEQRYDSRENFHTIHPNADYIKSHKLYSSSSSDILCAQKILEGKEESYGRRRINSDIGQKKEKFKLKYHHFSLRNYGATGHADDNHWLGRNSDSLDSLDENSKLSIVPKQVSQKSIVKCHDFSDETDKFAQKKLPELILNDDKMQFNSSFKNKINTYMKATSRKIQSKPKNKMNQEEREALKSYISISKDPILTGQPVFSSTHIPLFIGNSIYHTGNTAEYATGSTPKSVYATNQKLYSVLSEGSSNLFTPPESLSLSCTPDSSPTKNLTQFSFYTSQDSLLQDFEPDIHLKEDKWSKPYIIHKQDAYREYQILKGSDEKVDRCSSTLLYACNELTNEPLAESSSGKRPSEISHSETSPGEPYEYGMSYITNPDESKYFSLQLPSSHSESEKVTKENKKVCFSEVTDQKMEQLPALYPLNVNETLQSLPWREPHYAGKQNPLYSQLPKTHSNFSNMSKLNLETVPKHPSSSVLIPSRPRFPKTNGSYSSPLQHNIHSPITNSSSKYGGSNSSAESIEPKYSHESTSCPNFHVLGDGQHIEFSFNTQHSIKTPPKSSLAFIRKQYEQLLEQHALLSFSYNTLATRMKSSEYFFTHDLSYSNLKLLYSNLKLLYSNLELYQKESQITCTSMIREIEEMLSKEYVKYDRGDAV